MGTICALSNAIDHPEKKYIYSFDIGLSLISQSQEITWSGNLRAAIVYVIARLFR